MTEKNPAVPFFSLNISDIRVHKSVEILGNAFTEYHAAHHLFPYVPSYNLKPVGAWVEETFEGRKAPTFEMLSSVEFNVLADSLVNSVTTRESSLVPFESEICELMVRERVALDEQMMAEKASLEEPPASVEPLSVRYV